MAIKEKHEFVFTCDVCGDEVIAFTADLPDDWLLISDSAHIDVLETQYYSTVLPVRLIKEYKVSNANIKQLICPTCAQMLNQKEKGDDC